MKYEIFKYYARCNYEFLHGNGESATNHLLSKLHINPGTKILEIGFGIGSTLLKVSKNFPYTEMFGVEHSPHMFSTAKVRVQLSKIKNIQLMLLPEGQNMPFNNYFFDIIYTESVLGILPHENLNKLLTEIVQKLNKNGMFAINETMWKNGVDDDTINEFNKFCRLNYGFPTASENYKYSTDWIKNIESKGFNLTYNSLSDSHVPTHFKDFKNIKLKVYDFLNKLSRIVRRKKIKYKRSKKFEQANLLESRILIFKKNI